MTKTITINGWKVELTVDEDEHLTIYTSNQDGSKVYDVCADIETDSCFAVRLTTEKIENFYNNK